MSEDQAATAADHEALQAAAKAVSAAVPVGLEDFPPGWEELARAIQQLREVLYYSTGTFQP